MRIADVADISVGSFTDFRFTFSDCAVTEAVKRVAELGAVLMSRLDRFNLPAAI